MRFTLKVKFWLKWLSHIVLEPPGDKLKQEYTTRCKLEEYEVYNETKLKQYFCYQYLHRSETVSLCSDLWTRPTVSALGDTFCFFLRFIAGSLVQCGKRLAAVTIWRFMDVCGKNGSEYSFSLFYPLI